jgi:hypothetical protein
LLTSINHLKERQLPLIRLDPLQETLVRVIPIALQQGHDTNVDNLFQPLCPFIVSFVGQSGQTPSFTIMNFQLRIVAVE